MNRRVSIDLRCGRDEETSTRSLGDAEHVESSHDVRLDGFDPVVLVEDRRSGTGEVVDLVDLEKERLRDIMSNILKARVVQPLRDVLFPTTEAVIHTNHFISLILHETVNEVGTNETAATSDENTLLITVDTAFIQYDFRLFYRLGSGRFVFNLFILVDATFSI